MSCCGKKRLEQWSTPKASTMQGHPPAISGAASSPFSSAASSPVGTPVPSGTAMAVHATTFQTTSFQYVGRTSLMVVGPLTGRKYRFAETGAVVSIDNRDAPSMLAVPGLKRV